MNHRHKQRTLKEPVVIKGVGLHTGRKCKAVFLPEAENSGIKFQRTDLPGKPIFFPRVENVVDVVRGTTLGNGEDRIYTIEHILSALFGLGIDNVKIELDDSEPPVADGSAKPFVDALKKAGLAEQAVEKKVFVVKTAVEYASNQTMIRVEPAESFELHCEIDYNHPMIRQQSLVFRSVDDYEKDIAPARTFCFDYEIEALRKNGLAKGGSLDNAIVVGPDGIYNTGSSLRFQDEFVRHKILDLMGDLMLLGAPLQGRVFAKRCGHGHNVKFLRQLLQQDRSASSPVPVG